MREHFERFDRRENPEPEGPTRFGWLLLGLVCVLGTALWWAAVPRYVRFVYSLPPLFGTGAEKNGTLPGRAPGELAVLVADVGDGEGILLQAPGGVTTLIDGGEGQHPKSPGAPARDWAYELWVPLFQSMGLRHLDHLLATVPRTHHMGAQADVIGDIRFRFDTLYHPAYLARFHAYRRLHRFAERRGMKRIPIERGSQLDLGPGLVAVVLTGEEPPRSPVSASRVLFLQYGRSRFLLLSDATASMVRQIVLKWGDALRAEVLKVSGHGGGDAALRELIEVSRPDYLVAPPGANPPGASGTAAGDSTGNPGIRHVVRTGETGSVLLFTDGRRIRHDLRDLESKF